MSPIMSKTSAIHIEVTLDEEKVPEAIAWQATDTMSDGQNEARAMMLSFWDSAEKNALRIDLWTKKMMVDEMADFMYQTVMGMADSFQRATRDDELAGDLKKAATDFIQQFRRKQKPAADQS
jgi:gliding motility-associated protein GldC